MRVLLAEDNPDNREMLARRLQRRGFTVDCAEAGALAGAAATRQRPDLILMDVSMPVRSGLEATRALRAQPQTADLKIIALTAHAMASAREECMEAGCDAFATKPVDFASLLDTIATVTGRTLPAA
ncbi:MAG TPA: response regulator [Caulobacterales bacterium]|nr:response regulator [Caulobacterales bacterium]